MGVTKTIIQEGHGPVPQAGQVVTMSYTGWVKDTTKKDNKGTQFDSTFNENRKDFSTKIGVGQVIKGWDEAVMTMKLGEKARLDITSDYAYGNQKVGSVIKANDSLIFDVELKKID